MLHTYIEVELRSESGNLSGTVIPYDGRASVVRDNRIVQERIEPGALSTDGDIALTRSHDNRIVLASTQSDTLMIVDGPKAMTFVAQPVESRDAEDTMRLIKSGVLRGVSAEFFTESERFEGNTRVIEKGRLVGVSIVHKPAYPTTVEARQRRRRVWRH